MNILKYMANASKFTRFYIKLRLKKGIVEKS